MDNQERQFIESFISEYYEQDDYGRGDPIYFCILDVVYDPSTYEHDNDDFQYISKQGRFLDDTELGLAESLIKSGLYKKPDKDGCHIAVVDRDRFRYKIFKEEFVKLNGGKFLGLNKAEVQKNMFLLKSEAEQHLKENHRHYHKDARVHCVHAWRGKRQQKFFEILCDLFY